MKNSLQILFSLVLALGLFTACEESCDPVDVDAINAIYLRFDTGNDANSFEVNELDSIYYVRYQESFLDSFTFPVDTIQLYQLGFYDNDFGLRFSRGFPQGLPSGPPYYTEFKYRFMSHSEDWQVRLQLIEVEGGYLDDCNYEARLKRYVLNDDTIDVTGSKEFVPVFKD